MRLIIGQSHSNFRTSRSAWIPRVCVMQQWHSEWHSNFRTWGRSAMNPQMPRRSRQARCPQHFSMSRRHIPTPRTTASIPDIGPIFLPLHSSCFLPGWWLYWPADLSNISGDATRGRSSRRCWRPKASSRRHWTSPRRKWASGHA